MVQPGGIYRHFKGGEYVVLCVAKHTETEEPLVIYQSLAEPQKIWARPKRMWEEPVEREDYSGPRFTLIKEPEKN